MQSYFVRDVSAEQNLSQEGRRGAIPTYSDGNYDVYKKRRQVSNLLTANEICVFLTCVSFEYLDSLAAL